MTLVVFLPRPGGEWRWLRTAETGVVARGSGVPVPAAEEPVVAVTPADAVVLHWAELPDRSPAQAIAAARLLAAEASLTPLADLHVAVGREDGRAERPIAVVSAQVMQAWLADLVLAGLDARAIVPAPLLLPLPEEGYVAADLGGERVLRGVTSGFADAPGLTELVTGGDEPTLLAADAVDAAILAAVAAPALDLRQGAFSRRRRIGIEWPLVRRLAWLGAAILLVTLLVSLTLILRYNIAAGALEDRAEALARENLPRGETVNNADRQLADRLARLRGGGLGFSRTAAALFAIMRTLPDAEVTALNFDATGVLKPSVSLASEAQAADLVTRLRAQGFAATPSTFTNNGGRLTGDVTVGAP
ncbi:type II secretion system protein GspL [Sphingomonas aracearum]|uniref:General secretion pathway protein GspL n=1 Tax=Sphingomonas aracearum TaxID=2283317 RepID=A0A369VTI1_9SPHN|nr:type II secretion system protein GspL [Sphingomonas aracearum]RDE05149.1 general secretion pathway protein GspL [Sphingomonas aracearum]